MVIFFCVSLVKSQSFDFIASGGDFPLCFLSKSQNFEKKIACGGLASENLAQPGSGQGGGGGLSETPVTLNVTPGLIGRFNLRGVAHVSVTNYLFYVICFANIMNNT